VKAVKQMEHESLGIQFSIRNQRLETIDSELPYSIDNSLDKLLREIVDG
jgi:hypothetical protein